MLKTFPFPSRDRDLSQFEIESAISQDATENEMKRTDTDLLTSCFEIGSFGCGFVVNARQLKS
jgi:hypothetical protein